MLKLSVNDIVKHNENCYSFVIAVAKRAREIAEEAEEEGVMLDQQPVQMAVKEFVEGKFHIREGSETDDDADDAAESAEPAAGAPEQKEQPADDAADSEKPADDGAGGNPGPAD